MKWKKCVHIQFVHIWFIWRIHSFDNRLELCVLVLFCQRYNIFACTFRVSNNDPHLDLQKFRRELFRNVRLSFILWETNISADNWGHNNGPYLHICFRNPFVSNKYTLYIFLRWPIVFQRCFRIVFLNTYFLTCVRSGVRSNDQSSHFVVWNMYRHCKYCTEYCEIMNNAYLLLFS